MFWGETDSRVTSPHLSRPGSGHGTTLGTQLTLLVSFSRPELTLRFFKEPRWRCAGGYAPPVDLLRSPSTSQAHHPNRGVVVTLDAMSALRILFMLFDFPLRPRSLGVPIARLSHHNDLTSTRGEEGKCFEVESLSHHAGLNGILETRGAISMAL